MTTINKEIYKYIISHKFSSLSTNTNLFAVTLTKTSMVKNVFKRFYPGREYGHGHKLLNLTITALSKMPPERMQNSVTVLQKQLYTNKLVFLHFCNHFKEIPIADLTNDAFFIEWVHKSIHLTPTLQSRAFQLALEVTYNKRVFSQSILEDFYKNDFQILDLFNINKGFCDQSTIYSAVVTKYVSHYFNLSKKDIIVKATPIYMKKLDITPERQKIIEYNKKMTDNSISDMNLQERPYDYKNSKDISWNKNHVYFVDFDEIEKHGYVMLKNLSNSLNNQLKINALSPHAAKYAQHILKILQNKETSFQKTFENVYKYTLINQPPKDFRMPYIIPIKKANSEELKTTFTSEQLEKVKLELGNLTDVKARKAIESVQEDWDPALKEKVQQAMSSSLSHILGNNEIS